MTATALVREQIQRFLESEQPEVICISGDWGVGKTYLWRTSIDAARAAHAVALKRYAYVSLFGIGSLVDLKLALFENSVDLGESASESRTGKWMRWVKQHASFAEALPTVGDYFKAAGPLFFSTVKDQIICIDDIERRSDDLDVKDVMGLISWLKEQRRCKVVILLNDRALDDKEEADFTSYFEKVVDTHLRFSPSASDSVEICLNENDEVSKKLSGHCISLGISNIRVIKKIERFGREAAQLLNGIDHQVTDQALHSITLLAWSHFDKAGAPPIEYLRKLNSLPRVKGDDDEQQDPKIAAWNALLENYKFGAMDEFDFELLRGIEAGYFDKARLRGCALDLEKQVLLRRQDGDFESAWDLYHGSLENNEDEVLETISKSFKQTYKTISLMNLNGTIRLFRELGRDKEAEELLKFYVENRNEPREFWDLDDYTFEDSVTDPGVRDAIKKKFETFQGTYDLGEILEAIGKNSAWNSQEMDAIACMPTEEYYQLFKRLRGRALRRAINAALLSDRTANASDSMKQVTARAKEALGTIAAESRINARRLERFGIKPAAGAVPKAE